MKLLRMPTDTYLTVAYSAAALALVADLVILGAHLRP